MSELDVAKEKIAYLKVWLGILLVTDISTFGWLVSNVDTSATLLLWAGVVVVLALTFGISSSIENGRSQASSRTLDEYSDIDALRLCREL